MADLVGNAITSLIFLLPDIGKAMLSRQSARRCRVDGPTYSRTVAHLIEECTLCPRLSHAPSQVAPARRILMLCPYFPSKWFWLNFKYSTHHKDFKDFQKHIRSGVLGTGDLPNPMPSLALRAPPHLAALRKAVDAGSIELERYLVLKRREDMKWLVADPLELAWFKLFCCYTYECTNSVASTAHKLVTAILVFDYRRGTLDWQAFNEKYALEWNHWDRLCKVFSVDALSATLAEVRKETADDSRMIRVAGRPIADVIAEIKNKTEDVQLRMSRRLRLAMRRRRVCGCP